MSPLIPLKQSKYASFIRWWWVRVLPPPGTLIWRLPGLIRPRRTAGATHRFAESYEGFKLHDPKIRRPSAIVTPLLADRERLTRNGQNAGVCNPPKADGVPAKRAMPGFS